MIIKRLRMRQWFSKDVERSFWNSFSLKSYCLVSWIDEKLRCDNGSQYIMSKIYFSLVKKREKIFFRNFENFLSQWFLIFSTIKSCAVHICFLPFLTSIFDSNLVLIEIHPFLSPFHSLVWPFSSHMIQIISNLDRINRIKGLKGKQESRRDVVGLFSLTTYAVWKGFETAEILKNRFLLTTFLNFSMNSAWEVIKRPEIKSSHNWVIRCWLITAQSSTGKLILNVLNLPLAETQQL